MPAPYDMIELHWLRFCTSFYKAESNSLKENHHEHRRCCNTNPLIELRTFNFHFKKDKMGNKRKSVELTSPVPSAESGRYLD